MTEPLSNKIIGRGRRPGFLLEPLGWIQDPLGNAIATAPHLLKPLIEVDHGRMHLMALALAHLSGEVTPDLALKLLQGSKAAILNLSIGHHPVGIDRALLHLPPKVLAAESYRNLVDLLNDPVTAKFLHHSGPIKELTITGLHSLPASLRRPAIMTMFSRVEGMDQFVDGLRILASRAGLTFDTLANQIGALDQPEQVAAKITQLVDSLPLPETLLPIRIGAFRRLDGVAEVRALAKTWRNCLAEYLFNINDGRAAVYLSEDWEAVCFVCRYGRLGWFLLQTKGPRNVAIEPQMLVQIHNAFAEAGILQSSMIEAIKRILMTHEWSRRRQAQDPEEIFDDIALY